MKIVKIFAGIAVATVVALSSTSCENRDVEYGDFDYQTVYFGNQFPVRTLELGEDLYVDNSIDNEHKVIIKATIGGTRNNTKDITIGFAVDNTLCNGLYFNGTNTPLTPMPASYYELASNTMTIPAGSILGGVEVKLTDAFFADPKALSNNYVIPLVMTNVVGADSILRGTPLVANPNRCIDADWNVKPRDFVLYAVKYVNKWHGNYLRRGTDNVVKDGVTATEVRHSQYVENDPVYTLTTSSLSQLNFPLSFLSKQKVNLPIPLQLSFDSNSNCTIGQPSSSIQVSDSVLIYNIALTKGQGKFAQKGELNSFGGKSRDAIYLDYSISFEVQSTFPKAKLPLIHEVRSYATKDTLVLRDRGVAPEYFTVVKK
ncbi:MAG: hypothetical protein BGN96_12620 [Bacteroidales bacterium 45-6]|nr:MAG: hypothetical protein BGN96_12620 [Bacteroidales bacterium 45-6]